MESWIESFVEYTDNLESSPLFRKWAAIATISAVLEQKVWVTTSSNLYPNLYVFLVGNAGIGKTRAITTAMSFVRELPELHLGATSMTMASLVDHMNEAKRTIIQLPEAHLEYNSLYICADELSAFMDQFDSGLIAGLTTFFDCTPYSQGRRVNDIRIKIKRPQLSILCGTTPSNLIKLMPEFAWEQGFTSRVLLVYSTERPLIDVFNIPTKSPPTEMIHDIKLINALVGQMGWTTEYATAMHNWKVLGLPPVPQHPKLEHYCSRRFSHLIKLSMVASVDRGNDLMLTKDDFNKAMGWLLEAEAYMIDIFKTGGGSNDSGAMNDIQHFVAAAGPKGVSEHHVIRFAKDHVPSHSVIRVIEIMEKSGMIKAISMDKMGLKTFISP